MAKRTLVRDIYAAEVRKLERRIKNIAKSFDVREIDINIKTGRVTKKDVEYIKSFRRGKLQEAVKTVDYGTGEKVSVKEYKQMQRKAARFAAVTIQNWKDKVNEMDGKLSSKLINFIDRCVDRIGSEAVSAALVKLESMGVNLSYKTVNYDNVAEGYMTSLLNSIDEFGADSFTRDELEQAAQDLFYDIPDLTD